MVFTNLTVFAALCLSLPIAAAAAEFAEVPYNHALPDTHANTVALTFDDAPDDAGYTDLVLDALMRANAPATFFLNTHAHTPVATSARAQATLRRMLEEGHILGNHTARHLELREQSDAVIIDELDTVQATIDAILGGDAPRLTLMRAPYGRPFYEHDRTPNTDLVHFSRIAEILSQRAVHVGWNIDPCDWNAESSDVLVSRVRSLLDGDTEHSPRRGIILLHSNQRVTAEAMPRILALLQERSITIVNVEDYVEQQCGARSTSLF